LAKLKFMVGAPGCAAEGWGVADNGIAALLTPEDFVSPIRLAAVAAATTAACCWLNGKMNAGPCIMFGMGEDCCGS
jgi:hypothetical protein